MQTATETPTTAEAFAQADVKREQLEAKLTTARTDVEALRLAVEKERVAYRGALAQVELAGAPLPSRGALVAKERELTEAEDRVLGLEEAVRVFQVEWKRAKAAALREQAAAIRAEAAKRQARIHELEEEIRPRQQEIGVHSSWIAAEYPKAWQLEEEGGAALALAKNKNDPKYKAQVQAGLIEDPELLATIKAEQAAADQAAPRSKNPVRESQWRQIG